MILKKCHLILCIKDRVNFIKDLLSLKCQSTNKSNKDLKVKVLDNTGDIFNEMYYIYKEKYVEEKDALNEKEATKSEYTKLRLTDYCEYESEEEEKQTDKNPDKREPPKKSIENNVKELSKLVNKEESSMNKNLFQKPFRFDRPSALLRSLFHTS